MSRQADAVPSVPSGIRLMMEPTWFSAASSGVITATSVWTIWPTFSARVMVEISVSMSRSDRMSMDFG